MNSPDSPNDAPPSAVPANDGLETAGAVPSEAVDTGLVDTVRESLHHLYAWVEGFAGTPGAEIALFLVAFAESSFFPIPPDVLLVALCLAEPSKALLFALLCSAGSVLGGAAGYGIGYYGGRPLLIRLFKAERVEAVQSYFDRYNAWAIGIAGLTPVPYKVFTLAGGAFAINFRIFMLASIVSRSLRFFVVALLLWTFGEPIKAFLEQHLGWVSVVFVILGVVGFWIAGRGARGAARTPAAAEMVTEPLADEDAPREDSSRD